MTILWHTIPDSIAWALRNSLPSGWIAPREEYRWYWSWHLRQSGLLDRELTLKEADSIRGRLNGFGPIQFEKTWAAVERIDNTTFWRSSIEGTP